MAKGSGSDFENHEDEDAVNDEDCELGDEFIDSLIEGGDEGSFEEAEELDEEYRPLSKRGRISTNFRNSRGSPRGRSASRTDFAPQSGNMTNLRTPPRVAGPPPRFRGRGFGRGNLGPVFRGAPPAGTPPPGHFGASRGGPRFRGSSNWDKDWNSGAIDGQKGIPSLMAPIGMSDSDGNETNNLPSLGAGSAVGSGFSSNPRQVGTASDNTNGSANQRFSDASPVSVMGNKSSDGETVSVEDSSIEIWVETKTGEGKSYYYNAKSRDTTWTKPEGENIKVISQEQVEAMAVAAGISSSQQQTSADTANEEKHEMANMNVPGGVNMAHMMGSNNAMPPPNTMQPPPGMMPPPFGGPPFGGPPPFGIPPPGFAPTAFPGGFQPPGPWGFPQAGMSMQSPMMPPNMIPPQQQMAPGGYMPGMPMPVPGAEMFEDKLSAEIDPEILIRASEWSEHKAPDGRSYFYNAKIGESVWEKPQALKDLEVARLNLSQNNPPIIDKPPMDTANINTANSLVDSNQKQLDKRICDEQEGTSEEEKRDEVSSDEEKKIDQVGKEDNSKELMTDDAEKRKKEEEDKLVQKVQDKSKPVSSTPVPGTPWCVVWTGDGRVFFYNPSARTSVWERPDDLINRSDVTKMISTPPPVVLALKKENHDNMEEDIPAKKNKYDTVNEPVNVMSVNNTTEKHQINIGKEAAMEAEVRAARERAVVPLETRINSFREMLVEKEVSAFSTWEKELHKIVFDPRYLLLTSKERKQVFEKYVKERAEEERQEKRNRMKQRKEDYRKLMEEANLHGKSSFSEFASKYTKDERFKNIEKTRERESLFNEFILEVRKREKEEKSHKREQIRKEFLDLLREHSEIDRHTRWSDFKKKVDSDHRYKMVDSSSLREDYFREYLRMLKDERRHKEKEKSKKEKVDKDQESDPELGNASDVEKDKEAEKAARVEASLREREKEVQRTLAVHLRDRDNEREQHKHDEAVHHFNALLADLVRNSELNWREAKRQLRKDHRWELADLLHREEKEKLFNEHIEQLTKKKREKFRELLDETSEITLNSSWKDVRRSIKDDPRYGKFSSSERKCEKEFKEYMKDKLVAIKTDFRELLQETKLITHKSFSMVKENENYLKEIEDILKNDRRYLMMDYIADERKELLLAYLDDLEKRGPPPPPTASEPSRRIIK